MDDESMHPLKLEIQMNKKYISKFLTSNEAIKLNALLKKHGLEYYGFYWFVIDKLMQEPDYRLPAEKYYFEYMSAEIPEHNRTQSNKPEQVFEHMFNICSNLFKLFTVKNGFFYSELLKEHFEIENKVIEKRRKAGGKSGEARRLKAEQKKIDEQNRTHVQLMFPVKDAVMPIEKVEKVFDEKKDDTPIVHIDSIDILKKGAGKKTKSSRPKKQQCLFRHSPYYNNMELFVQSFGEKYQKHDLDYYYQRLLNWSDSGENKKVDWIATGRNFILSDENAGKVRFKSQTISTSINDKFNGKDN